MNIEKYISPLIASQFPSFYKEEGPNFIAFVKAYYEWMEQENNILNRTRSLPEYTDIDTTTEEFIKYFKNTFISSLPSKIVADKRLLVKHILDLYRAKGTKKAYELLFRLVFNEDISFYFPGDHLFESSAATWYVPKYVEVTDSPYLQQLVGKKIYNTNAEAIVESYFIKKLNNKIINVLYISNLQGRFKFGEPILCDDLYVNVAGEGISFHQYNLLDFTEKQNYQLAITTKNAPLIFGSLSAIGIVNGGSNFNVGDQLSVEGTGKGGVARVISTRSENGKVSFSLLAGGFGFTTNAIVTVVGGYGTGASFKIGGITNKVIYEITLDKITDYYATQIDADGSGIDININTSTGNMSIGEQVTSSANVVFLDVKNLNGLVSNGDILSNTSLNISNLNAYWSDESLISITGSDSNITNANLVPGTILQSNSGATVSVNLIFPKQTVTGNATVVVANSSAISVNHVNGYFIPAHTVTGSSSGKTANITSVSRLNDWVFPKAVDGSNLDTPKIGQILRIEDLEVGTITYLTAINPGVGYSSAPTVDVVEPDIYDLRIPDGIGGYYGHNAQINAKAGVANGIVSGIEIVDSGFGYVSNETVTINTSNGVSSITGVSVVDLNGIGTGYWKDSKGFSSDESFLEDSYYYQKFSYEIITKKMLNTYKKMVKDLVHPSGTILFGRYRISDEVVSENLSVPYFNLASSS
jgi:hypothetical protein